jgi:hypothetical protein
MADRINGLLGPRIANLLWRPIQGFLFAICSVDNIITAVDRFIHNGFQISLISLKPLGNAAPGRFDSQQ